MELDTKERERKKLMPLDWTHLFRIDQFQYSRREIRRIACLFLLLLALCSPFIIFFSPLSRLISMNGNNLCPVGNERERQKNKN